MTRPRRWSILAQDPDVSSRLAHGLNVHPIVGALLYNRGVRTVEAGTRYLSRKLADLHDPELHPGIADAADRIFRAVEGKKNICIYGDYDVDGMCATAILLECLRLGGARPRFYVPDRLEEGYGLNADALDRLRAEGIDLVVTVDCGIASVAEADHARALGLELVITDHHEFATELPRADALVHPRLPGSTYPFGGLCGTGVAFKLAWELGRRFSGGRKTTEAFQTFLVDATSLAAIGTICDVVPLEDENRVLVHHGLKGLKARPPVGLASLMELAGIGAKSSLDTGDIGFTVGPRLNACGRLGQARLGVELLVTRDPARALELARYLDEENKQRQTLERRVFQEARELAESEYNLDDPEGAPILVLAKENWHPGVIGIVAGRMVERYHRPCILISLGDEEGAGSGRSLDGFHLQQALAQCAGSLVKSGGHAMAAGLRVRRALIDQFRAEISAVAASAVAGTELVAEERVDVEVPLHVLTPQLLKAMEILQPFGMANPAPTMLATNLDLVGEPRRVGNGERHLSFRVRQGNTTKKAIGFGLAERALELTGGGGKCCVVFQPIVNEFRGFPEVEMRIRDFRAAAQVSREACDPCPVPQI